MDRKSYSYSRILIASSILVFFIALLSINIAPRHAFGGIVWFKNGPHYISGSDYATRLANVMAPQIDALKKQIGIFTPLCDSLENGFCQKSPGSYYLKTLDKAAVPYDPGTPDKKVLVGYCTLCNDGTYSPSCAIGRGACSYHAGVATYNYPEYRTIPGVPATPFQPAEYTYTQKSFTDSPQYVSPTPPSLSSVLGY